VDLLPLISEISDTKKAIQGLTAAVDSNTKAYEDRGVPPVPPSVPPVHPGGNHAGAEREKAKSGLNHLSANMIAGNIIQGLNLLAGTTNRASIVNKLGAGDGVGAGIEETRRKVNVINGVGGMTSGVLGAFNPALGAAGQVATSLLTLPSTIKANEDETKNAKVEQWEKHMRPAMDLNALLHNVSGSAEENSQNIRESFGKAAESALKFGYKLDEGTALVSQMARQGLGENSYAAASNVMHYERSTGASRETLARAEGRFRKFGADNGNALGWAYAGNSASGMDKGRYEEFLQGMQRIFEDGIGKGFSKGAREIAADMSFFSKLSGGNEMWKGEQGAKRITDMNNSLAAATSLSSVTDVLTFRAASGITQNMNEKEWAKMVGGTAEKPDIRKGDSYVDAMIAMEHGMSAELFTAQMEQFGNAEGGWENRDDVIGRIKEANQGMNWTGAAQLYEFYDKKKDGGLSDDSVKKELDRIKKDPGNYESKEMQMLTTQQKIADETVKIGQTLVDWKNAALQKELGDMRAEEEVYAEQAEMNVKTERAMATADERLPLLFNQKTGQEAAISNGLVSRIAEAKGSDNEGEKTAAFDIEKLLTTADPKILSMANKQGYMRDDDGSLAGVNQIRDMDTLVAALDALRTALTEAEVVVKAESSQP
jgi:hypothetical protein